MLLEGKYEAHVLLAEGHETVAVLKGYEVQEHVFLEVGSMKFIFHLEMYETFMLIKADMKFI